MRTPLRIVLVALCVALIAPNAQAADLAPLQVMTDAAIDGGLLYPDYELEAQDLIAGYIAETDTTIDVTWEVVDLPDGSGGIPEIVHYYWEFTLDAPDDGKDAQAFSLRARMDTAVNQNGGPHNNGLKSATLQGNCTVTQGVTRCTVIPGTVVTVTIDDVANTVTAHVRREDLKAGDVPIAVDGAVLSEATLFEGIATYTGAVAIAGATHDLADMDADYVLGTPRA